MMLLATPRPLVRCQHCPPSVKDRPVATYYLPYHVLATAYACSRCARRLEAGGAKVMPLLPTGVL